MASGVAGQSKVIYLYGVTKKQVSPGKLTGVDGTSLVEAVPRSGLICWISEVSRKDFADNLSANMENLDWLAEASVQHQHVVSAISREEDMLPARFGTVFLSQQSLDEDMRRKKRILEKDFKKIQGADEYGVKVFGVAPRVELPTVDSRSGKDYLKAKAALLQRRPSRTEISNTYFQTFENDLQQIAVATAEPGRISSGQKGLQWQTSILLRRSDRKKFDALLRKYSRQWTGERQIECTGPWPPYSFVSRTPE